MLTCMKPKLSDVFPGVVVEVVDDRLNPGVVRVAWIVNVAAVHLQRTSTCAEFTQTDI